jgi:hypothetical protein
MAGIKEHRDVGALRLLAEVEQLFGHGVAGQVGALDHFETDIAQHRRHRLGVDRRVRKLRDILVGAVADDKGDTLVGLCRIRGEQHANQGEENGAVAHLKSPKVSRLSRTMIGFNASPQVTRKNRTSRQNIYALPGFASVLRDRFKLARCSGGFA